MPRTSLKGDAKQKFSGQDFGPFRRYATLDDIRQYLPSVWLLRPKDISASLTMGDRLLQRLSRLLAHRFLNEEWSSILRPDANNAGYAHPRARIFPADRDGFSVLEK